MADIVPELLKMLKEDFKRRFNVSGNIDRLNKLLEDGKSMYKYVNELSMELGDILAAFYRDNLSSERLSVGKMN